MLNRTFKIVMSQSSVKRSPSSPKTRPTWTCTWWTLRRHSRILSPSRSRSASTTSSSAAFWSAMRKAVAKLLKKSVLWHMCASSRVTETLLLRKSSSSWLSNTAIHSCTLQTGSEVKWSAWRHWMKQWRKKINVKRESAMQRRKSYLWLRR